MADQTYGYLIVNTRTAQSALPLGDTAVAVYPTPVAGEAPGTVRADASATAVTGPDGATPIFTLPAPPRIRSEVPGMAGPVFAAYRIVCTRPSYRPTVHPFVPVFEGITSVQTVEMIPIGDGTPTDPVVYEGGTTGPGGIAGTGGTDTEEML